MSVTVTFKCWFIPKQNTLHECSNVNYHLDTVQHILDFNRHEDSKESNVLFILLRLFTSSAANSDAVHKL